MTAIDINAFVTVTEKFRIVVFPATSATVTVSFVVPCGKIDALARGVAIADATPLSASEGEGKKFTTAPKVDVAATVTFGRFAADGGVLSSLTMSVWFASMLPDTSVA